MFENKNQLRDKLLLVLSVAIGLVVGMVITSLCIEYKLYVFGVNINIFIAPMVAGFVETFVSNKLRNKSSGAISAIILFFITNGIGWLFPKTPLSFNIFTVGGFILMLQAAFPLMVNYLIIGVFFMITYLFGLAGSFIELKFNKKEDSHVHVGDIEPQEDLGVKVFNSKPAVPIKEYHGMVFSEDVIDFDEKEFQERLEYVGSTIENKSMLKSQDYATAREYVLYDMEKEALKLGANAIIELQFEYTNYNQQIPPDVIIAAYGTAVTIDDKYL